MPPSIHPKFPVQHQTVIDATGRAGVFLLTRAVLKHLSREHSRVINIGSTATQEKSPAVSTYGGSRPWYTTTRNAEYGYTVNAVAPGPVGTYE